MISRWSPGFSRSGAENRLKPGLQRTWGSGETSAAEGCAIAGRAGRSLVRPDGQRRGAGKPGELVPGRVDEVIGGVARRAVQTRRARGRQADRPADRRPRQDALPDPVGELQDAGRNRDSMSSCAALALGIFCRFVPNLTVEWSLPTFIAEPLPARSARNRVVRQLSLQ